MIFLCYYCFFLCFNCQIRNISLVNSVTWRYRSFNTFRQFPVTKKECGNSLRAQCLVMPISTSFAFFCLKFSLQQIAIHIYYQIKIACNRPGVIVVSKHYSFKQKNSCSSTLTMLSLHDIFDKIKTKFQELECEWTGQMEEYTQKKIYRQKRSFSSSIKSLSVHSDCRI